VCRKKWNKIKKSSLSSKFKGMPRDGRLSSDNLIKLKESSTSMELFSRGLYVKDCDAHHLMFCKKYMFA